MTDDVAFVALPRRTGSTLGEVMTHAIIWPLPGDGEETEVRLFASEAEATGWAGRYLPSGGWQIAVVRQPYAAEAVLTPAHLVHGHGYERGYAQGLDPAARHAEHARLHADPTSAHLDHEHGGGTP